jgi:uncharacterized protein (DUF433 family)
MAQEAGRIAHELLDEPHVAGHRVSVRRIHALVEERGLAPQSVANGLRLDVADIYRALAYYHDNPGELHAVEQHRERRIEQSRERGAPTGPEDL